jgi:Putative binding domain, N-terminal/Viral BACON domain
MGHRRPRGAVFFLAIVVTWAVAVGRDATAQTVNPTTVEFAPSADHNVTLPNGTAAVTRYDLGFYNAGAASPFQVESLGKPTPAGDGLIRVLLSSVLTSFPSPGIVYESRVTAVGPGGIGRSAPSNTFIFTTPCTYSIAPTSQALAAGGGTGNATVSTGSGCAWTAASNAPWISVTSGATGNGNGTASYAATANTTTSSRTGTLTIAGQTLTVTQVACSSTLSPTTQNIAAVGGAANATVSTTSGCPWTAASNVTWLSITSGGSGSGNGTVNYSAATNTSTTPRTGTLTIAGRTLTVTQAGACIFTVSPTAHSISGAAATLSSTVTTTSGCVWTATSNASWISITSGGNGSGNGTVNYSVAANTTTTSRNGTLTIAGQTVTITQAPGLAAPSNVRIDRSE